MGEGVTRLAQRGEGKRWKKGKNRVLVGCGGREVKAREGAFRKRGGMPAG